MHFFFGEIHAILETETYLRKFSDYFRNFRILELPPKKTKKKDFIEKRFCVYSSFKILLLSFSPNKQKIRLLHSVTREVSRSLPITFWTQQELFLVPFFNALDFFRSDFSVSVFSIKVESCISSFVFSENQSFLVLQDENRLA